VVITNSGNTGVISVTLDSPVGFPACSKDTLEPGVSHRCPVTATASRQNFEDAVMQIAVNASANARAAGLNDSVAAYAQLPAVVLAKEYKVAVVGAVTPSSANTAGKDMACHSDTLQVLSSQEVIVACRWFPHQALASAVGFRRRQLQLHTVTAASCCCLMLRRCHCHLCLQRNQHWQCSATQLYFHSSWCRGRDLQR
jgi:hypothetical protein